MYASDNNNYLPVSGQHFAGITVVPTEWYREISPYLAQVAISNTTLTAAGTVVTCPSADLALLYQIASKTTDPNTNGIGGYGHNYPFLGYYDGYMEPFGRQKLSDVIRPSDTVFNSDTLDPLPSDTADLEYYGYSYAISYIPEHLPGHAYTRHSKGDNYSWGDGHAQYMLWLQASKGQGTNEDWYWALTK